MRIAFSYSKGCIAPVLDASRHFRVVDIQKGNRLESRELVLDSLWPYRMVQILQAEGIEEVVCGALSRALEMMLQACGIKLLNFVSGDLNAVIQARAQGNILEIPRARWACRRRQRGQRCQGARYNFE